MKRKELRVTAPEVHEAFLTGNFVCRRTDGCHNAVSPDMLLEQIYNADVKEESGLGGVTTNPSAHTKWVYTKCLTSAVSSQLKTMLHLHSQNRYIHHKVGQGRIAKGAEMVINVMASVEYNPFTTSPKNLINIATGQHADSEVEQNLINILKILVIEH